MPLTPPKPLTPLTLFSVVIPARDESESLPSTLAAIYATFTAEKIPHEIVVVDDGSKDRTWAVLQELRATIPTLAPVQNLDEHGFGRAVVCGLDHSRGDAVVIMMADASDAPADAVRYWHLLGQGFAIPLNDTTNAFKAYRRTVIDGCRPFLAPHFNLTVEIPLKAIARGYSFTITPISWHNRKFGVAKLKIKEMGSRYFFICAYVWLEKYFSRGDYRRRT